MFVSAALYLGKEQPIILKNYFIFQPPRGVDDAEKLQVRIAGVLNKLLGIGRNVYHVSRVDFGCFVADIHHLCRGAEARG